MENCRCQPDFVFGFDKARPLWLCTRDFVFADANELSAHPSLN